MTWAHTMYYIKKLIPCRKKNTGPLKSSLTHLVAEDELRQLWQNIQPTYHLCSACKCCITLYGWFRLSRVHQINHGKSQPFAWIIEFNFLRLMLWHSGIWLVCKWIHNRGLLTCNTLWRSPLASFLMTSRLSHLCSFFCWPCYSAFSPDNLILITSSVFLTTTHICFMM